MFWWCNPPRGVDPSHWPMSRTLPCIYSKPRATRWYCSPMGSELHNSGHPFEDHQKEVGSWNWNDVYWPCYLGLKMIDITIMNEWYLTYPSMLVAYSVLKRVCKSFWRPLEIAPNLKSHTNPINTSPTSKNSSIIQYPLRRRLFKRKAPTHPTSYKMK